MTAQLPQLVSVKVGRPNFRSAVEGFGQIECEHSGSIRHHEALNEFANHCPHLFQRRRDNGQRHNANATEKQANEDTGSSPQVIGDEKAVHPHAEPKKMGSYYESAGRDDPGSTK
jgi:hypothetical protein